MNTAQARDALAAHLVSGDDDLARQLASDLPPGQLPALVLELFRMYGFSMVDSFQRSGLTADDAKRKAVDHFRVFAQHET